MEEAALKCAIRLNQGKNCARQKGREIARPAQWQRHHQAIALERAKARGIQGRLKMSKRQLEKALH